MNQMAQGLTHAAQLEELLFDFRQPPPGWDEGFEFHRGPNAGPADHADFSEFFSSIFGNRGGISCARAERWGNADQLFVEEHDRGPLGPASARPLSVDRLNRGLELKPASAAPARRFREMALRLIDQWLRPQL